MLKTEWMKPSRSSAQHANCVQARLAGGAVELRNSNDPSGPFVRFTEAEWRTFIECADEFKIQ
jgi:hypothetical protein